MARPVVEVMMVGWVLYVLVGLVLGLLLEWHSGEDDHAFAMMVVILWGPMVALVSVVQISMWVGDLVAAAYRLARRFR